MNKLVEALKLEADGKFSLALALVNDLISPNYFPNNPFLQRLLGQIYYYLGDYDKVPFPFLELIFLFGLKLSLRNLSPENSLLLES